MAKKAIRIATKQQLELSDVQKRMNVAMDIYTAEVLALKARVEALESRDGRPRSWRDVLPFLRPGS